MSPADDLDVLPFTSAEAWHRWLEEHHAASPGLWVMIPKKGSGIDSVHYPDVLESALCSAFLYRLHDAKKPETRARRLATFAAMLEAGETLH